MPRVLTYTTLLRYEDELVGAQQIVARVGARQAPAKGDVVRLAADPESVHVFSNATQERIS